MGKKISMDNPVFRAMGRAADLFVLNILFLLTCIPVITIGAAQSALYAVTLKMVRGEESYLIKSYLKALKENLRQATAVWLLSLAMSAVMYENFRLLPPDSPVRRVLMVIGIFGCVILVFTFPLLARFENTVWRTLNNALFMAIRHLPWTAAVCFATVLPVAVTLKTGRIVTFGIPYWMFMGFSVTALVNSWFFRKIFSNYEA